MGEETRVVKNSPQYHINKAQVAIEGPLTVDMLAVAQAHALISVAQNLQEIVSLCIAEKIEHDKTK